MAVVHDSGTETGGDVGRRFSLFAVTFAAAVLFHLAGNPPAGFLPVSTLLIVVQVALGAAAAVVLLSASRRTAVCTPADAVCSVCTPAAGRRR